jgi:hypothetical protein
MTYTARLLGVPFRLTLAPGETRPLEESEPGGQGRSRMMDHAAR